MNQPIDSPNIEVNPRPKYARLLIVDDEASLLEMLVTIFREQGYEVEAAATGADALQKARGNNFDVALIDYMLPDISGPDVLSQLSELSPKTSCVMMSAYASAENILQAMNVRASGFITKPLELPSLLLKVAEAVDRHHLSVENQNLLEALQAAYQRLEDSYQREHRIAEILQRALLPSLPKRIGPFDVGEYYQVSLQEARVGGDIYDVIDHGDGRFSILIADVSGKGLQAAVQMGRVYYSTRALGMAFLNPVDLIYHLNRTICCDNEPAGFVTLFYGVFDMNDRVLTYVNAGHEPPILLSPAGGYMEELVAGGPLLGVEELNHLGFEIGECELQPGDTLALFTDGLSELRSEDGLLERGSLQGWLMQASYLSPEMGAAALIENAQKYAKDSIRDDLAILLLKYNPGFNTPQS